MRSNHSMCEPSFVNISLENPRRYRYISVNRNVRAHVKACNASAPKTLFTMFTPPLNGSKHSQRWMQFRSDQNTHRWLTTSAALLTLLRRISVHAQIRNRLDYFWVRSSTAMNIYRPASKTECRPGSNYAESVSESLAMQFAFFTGAKIA
jgi:hypothetical protein